MNRESFEFLSSDTKSTIHGYVWRPSSTPKGIVLLVHGMAEHIGRYDEFAQFLAGQGFLVAGHDQIGHGLSAEEGAHGFLPAREGKDLLLADVDKLCSMAQELCEKPTPCFIFGHSLGSFITRCYISRTNRGLSGAILCGTGTVKPALSKVGNALACHLSRQAYRFTGKDYVSPLLESMGVGAYAKAIKDAKTPIDWLSYNTDNIERYSKDPLSGFPFSAGGYATVTSLTLEACSENTAAKVPHDLPLLFIAGNGDPVGSMGEGVKDAAQLAIDAGSTDVSCTIYPHMRHEILNEDNKAQVMDDVLKWIEAHIPAAQKET